MNKIVIKFLLLFCFISTTISGELSVTYIKTFQNVFKPENSVLPAESNHLSPTWGAILWHSPFLENLYRYGNQNHGMVKLAQELFFLHHDNVTFDATYLPTKIASHFEPQDIGILIGIIENHRSNPQILKTELDSFIVAFELNNTLKIKEGLKQYFDNAIKKTKKEMSLVLDNVESLIAQDAKITKLKSELKDPNLKKRWIQSKKDLIARESKLLIKSKIDPLKVKIGLLTKLKKDEVSKRDIIADPAYQKFKTSFIDSLIKAIQEENHIYPTYLTTYILLALHWKKSNHPNDFIDLLWGIYSTLNNKSILFNNNINSKLGQTSLTKEQFISIMQQNMNAQGFDQTKYFNLTKSISPDINNLENLAISYLGFHVFENLLPDAVTMSLATLVRETVFPDCAETSLLNLFIALIFDPQTRNFDTSILEQIGAKQQLIDFFKTHDLSNIYTQQAHNSLARVVSNLEDVQYAYKKCEIDVGLKNMLLVIQHLVGKLDGENSKAKLESLKNKFTLDKVKITDIEPNQDPNTNDKNLTLNITIQKKATELIIKWIFYPEEFVMEYPPKAENLFSLKSFDFFKSQKFTTNPYQDLKLVFFLNLFGGLDGLKLDVPLLYKYFSYFMQNLRIPENTIKLVKILVKDSKISDEIKINLIRNIYSKIPNDEYSQNAFWDNVEFHIFKVFYPSLEIFKNLTDTSKCSIISALLKQPFNHSNPEVYKWIKNTLPSSTLKDAKGSIIRNILVKPIPQDAEFKSTFINFYQWIKGTLPYITNDYKFEIIKIILAKPIPQDPEFNPFFINFYQWIKGALPTVTNDYNKFEIIGNILAKPIPQDPEFNPFFINFYQWIKDTLPTVTNDYNKFEIIGNILAKPIPQDPEFNPFFINFYQWIKDTLPTVTNDYNKFGIIGNILAKPIPQDPEFNPFFINFYQWIKDTLPTVTDGYNKFEIIKIILAKPIPQDPEFYPFFINFYQWIKGALPTVTNDYIKFEIQKLISQKLTTLTNLQFQEIQKILDEALAQ